MRRNSLGEAHASWDAGLNLGSTREGDQASGRNGKASTLYAVEMGVNWCADVVMKEEREVNCGASNYRSGRREQGERSKQTRLDCKASRSDKVTSWLLQWLEIITIQIEEVHRVPRPISNLK